MGQATPPSPPPQNQNQLARCVGWHHQQSTFADWARLSVSGFPAEQSKGLTNPVGGANSRVSPVAT